MITMAKIITSICFTKELPQDENIVIICSLKHDLKARHYTTDYEHPYPYDVLYDYDAKTKEIASISIDDADELLKNIDNEDCLPDFGPFEYKGKIGTLREILKQALQDYQKSE